MGSLTVVGLGPGPAEWVTRAGRDALLAPGARVLLRTASHPAVERLLAGTRFESFDALYERAASLEALHREMADLLSADARLGDVVLGVPGDGALGEALLGLLSARGVDVRVIPGVSVAAAALAAARVSASCGAQQVEATALGGSGLQLLVEPNPRWPLVVTGVYRRSVASDVKLALQRVYPAEQPVRIVHHPGLPDERLATVPLSAMDRGELQFDHLTHLVLEPVATEDPTGSAQGLRAIISRLRAPEIGCPWDLKQTHVSLIPYVIEEAYEVVDAIQDGDSTHVMDELGDLLLQVVLHAELADQEGDFDLNDVQRAISAKLIRRHPHVFGQMEARGAEDVVRNWDRLKAAERGGDAPPASALDGIVRSLPALKVAREQGRRAVQAGFAWTDREGALAKLREEVEELLAAPGVEERREELGDLLWMLAHLADAEQIDAEEALRQATRKFAARFRAMEVLARERGWDGLRGRPHEELQSLWNQAKAATGALPRHSTER